MATTFTKIASVNVGLLGASSMAFTSIPATYTDLVIKGSARINNASNIGFIYIKFNGSAASLTRRNLYGDGSGTASYLGSDGESAVMSGNSATASTFGSFDFYLPNYAGSNNKSMSADSVSENNATGASQNLAAILWSNTAAITSITIEGLANFMQYSTATLYGISKS